MGTFQQAITRVMGNDLAERLLGSGVLALGVKVVSAALSFVMLAAFARMMSAGDFGRFAQMLNLAIVVAAVLGLGLPTAVLRFWPGHMAKSEVSLAAGFARDAQRLLLAAGCLAILAGAVAGYFQFHGESLGLRWGWLWVAVLGGLFSYGDYYSSLLRAQGSTAWSLVPRDIVWRIAAPVGAGLWLSWTGQLSPQAAMAMSTIVMLVTALAQAAISARNVQKIAGAAPPQSNWMSWRRPLLPLAGASILYAMVQQLDVVIVGALIGPAEAGAYFAAQKTASLLGLVMIAGGLVAAPLMSAAYHAGRIEELQRMCRILGLAIAVVTLVGLCLMALIGDRLLAIFDPAFSSSYPVLIILALGFTIDALAGPSAYLMQMTSLEGPYLRLMAIVYAFVLSLQFLLVPQYGVIAAAAASAVGVCLWNIIAVGLLRNRIGVDPSLFGYFFPPKAIPQ
jgi:O-antigen/teichoic acid export membrane protein